MTPTPTMERDSLVARLERVRHKKRGSEYEVLGIRMVDSEFIAHLRAALSQEPVPATAEERAASKEGA